MTQLVNAKGPEDFLAVVPALAGFQPENSLLVVPFHGKRSVAAIRLDLAVMTQPTVPANLLDHFDHADAVVLVVYTDAEFAEPMNYGPEMFAMREDIEDRGYHIRDMLLVARDGWASYFNGKRRPLSEIGAGALPIMNPASATHTDLAILPEGVEVGPGIAERFDRHERIVGAHAVAVIEDSLTDHDDDMLSDLALVLAYPSTRDGAMLQWARGEEWGTRALVTRDPEDQEVLSAHIDLATGYGPMPNPDRLHSALRAVKHVAAWLPEEQRPPALTVAGWLTWALGMGGASDTLLSEAMRIDPKYNFAWILHKYIGGGRIPLWAFDAANQRDSHE